MLGIAFLYFLIAFLLLVLAAQAFSPSKESNKFAAGLFVAGAISNLSFSLFWVFKYFNLN